MSVMLQLNPPIPVVTLKGKGLAHVIIDYGPEHDLVWVVFQDITGECWTWRSSDVRANDNFVFSRVDPKFKSDPLDEV
jgi:hypothetical protein